MSLAPGQGFAGDTPSSEHRTVSLGSVSTPGPSSFIYFKCVGTFNRAGCSSFRMSSVLFFLGRNGWFVGREVSFLAIHTLVWIQRPSFNDRRVTTNLDISFPRTIKRHFKLLSTWIGTCLEHWVLDLRQFPRPRWERNDYYQQGN